MAKSWVRAESTSLWTLPALPAPPDDALPPPLFICGFCPSQCLCTLFSGCRGGRWEQREAEGRPERTDRGSSRAPAPVRPPPRTAVTWALGRPRSAPPAPRTLGSRLPGGTSSSPGKGGGRQTDRATSPFSLRPNSARARTQRKKRRRGSSGAGSAAAGLTAPASGAEGGGYVLRRRGHTGPRRGTRRCRGGRRGARGEHGCRGQRSSTGLKATGSGGSWWGSGRPARRRSNEAAREGSGRRRRGQ